MRQKTIYFRFCNSCSKKYKPDGKCQKLCNKCKLKIAKDMYLKRKNKMKKEERFELNYCEKCIQMTNWENGECAKCKIKDKNKKKW